jgi:hypothetical protein
MGIILITGTETGRRFPAKRKEKLNEQERNVLERFIKPAL